MVYTIYDTRFDIGTMVFIGSTREEILPTLEHYKGRGLDFSSGLEAKAVERDKFYLSCFEGMSNPELDTEIPVDDNGSVIAVNPTAFERIKSVVLNADKNKRGHLYKLPTGNPVMPLVYIPENVMQKLREYDWEGASVRVRKNLADFEARLRMIQDESAHVTGKPRRVGMN